MDANPRIDVSAAAQEVKSILDTEKMDLIDWGYSDIECYPDPSDDAYPVLKAFAGQWAEFFDYADEHTQEDGTGFPEEIAKKYESVLAEVADNVNADQEFWSRIRAAVMPLYEIPGEAIERAEGEAKEKLAAKQVALAEKWKNRWQAIKLFYDPVGINVVTTRILRDKESGKIKHRESVSKRSIPQGFVIKVL